MEIIRYPSEETRIPACVAALGFFDGVHIGHRELIALSKRTAEEHRLPLAVFTFPADSPALKSRAKRLSSTEEKCAIFEKLGADTVILCDFDTVKDLSPETFVTSLLIGRFGVKIAVTGSDFRFGKGAEGTSETLAALLRANGSSHLLCPDCRYEGETVSSARIRSLLEKGDLRKAEQLLGAPIAFSGQVCHGIGLAGKEGIPTVNTFSEKLDLIPRGVYASVCKVGGDSIPSITNVGICPTVGDRPLHAETHLLDYSGDMYGKEIQITLLDFCRPEKQFSSQEELFLQIKLDILARKERKD